MTPVAENCIVYWCMVEMPYSYMMNGKSVQRTLRGYLLVDRCPSHLIVSDLLKDNEQQFESMVDQVEETYSSLVANENFGEHCSIRCIDPDQR